MKKHLKSIMFAASLISSTGFALTCPNPSYMSIDNGTISSTEQAFGPKRDFYISDIDIPASAPTGSSIQFDKINVYADTVGAAVVPRKDIPCKYTVYSSVKKVLGDFTLSMSNSKDGMFIFNGPWKYETIGFGSNAKCNNLEKCEFRVMP